MITENYFAPIAALDLDPIKVKLMHEESGEGWSRAYADAIEFEYRRFLYLVKKFPDEQAAPLFDVDVFWHYHILDTMKYAADCEAVFGYFLHHFPYLGLRGDDDLKVHHQVGERMRELYERTYGEEYVRRAASPVESSKVAFSLPASALGLAGRANKTAFSLPANKTAFSLPANQTAFSLPAGKAASSMPAAQFAFSLPTVTAGLQDAATAPLWSHAAAAFNTSRPTLSREV